MTTNHSVVRLILLFAILALLGLVHESRAQLNTTGYSTQITVDGDADTYYPVVFDLPHDGIVYDLFIGRTYTMPGPSSWHSVTHKPSLVFHVKLTSTGWGGTPPVAHIQSHKYQYAPTIAKASYVAHRLRYCVWLRGGGGIYNISGNFPQLGNPSIYYASNYLFFDYTTDAYDEYISPVATAELPVIDYETFYARDGNFGVGVSSPQAALHVQSWTQNQGDNTMRLTPEGLGGYSSHIHYGPTGDWYLRSALAAGKIVLQDTGGNVGIGTGNPQNELDVNGTIRAKEVIVESGWADHVFGDDYELMPLSEVGRFIDENRRLPGVPSAAEVAQRGASLGETQRILLEKVEELTLHLIEKDRQLDALTAVVAKQQAELDRMNSQHPLELQRYEPRKAE